MAEANGNQTQDTTMDNVQTQQATMKVYGTNEPYIGRMVTIAGYEYTTVGGALEGDSLQLIPIENGNSNETIIERVPIGSTPVTTANVTGNENPIVSLFQAPTTPRYRRSDNNQLVAVGANLHEHQDGTIMTEHSMGPNDNSVIVFVVTNDNQNDGTNGGTNGQTPPPDITPPPSDGGNTTQGGGGGY
tara:strand:- start:91 stop:654 length:564 start_codon:yes stop_codon:yes gene_type:complete